MGGFHARQYMRVTSVRGIAGDRRRRGREANSGELVKCSSDVQANTIAENTTPTSPTNPLATFTIASLLLLVAVAALPLCVPVLLPDELGFGRLVGRDPANPVSLGVTLANAP
jgi:hypothetical protein